MADAAARPSARARLSRTLALVGALAVVLLPALASSTDRKSVV